MLSIYVFSTMHNGSGLQRTLPTSIRWRIKMKRAVTTK